MKHSYNDYFTGKVSFNDFYGQFVNESFKAVALEAVKYKTIQQREQILSGYYAGNPNNPGVIRNMTIALWNRFPEITKKLKEAGTNTSLSSYVCIASAAVETDGIKWTEAFGH